MYKLDYDVVKSCVVMVSCSCLQLVLKSLFSQQIFSRRSSLEKQGLVKHH